MGDKKKKKEKDKKKDKKKDRSEKKKIKKSKQSSDSDSEDSDDSESDSSLSRERHDRHKKKEKAKQIKKEKKPKKQGSEKQTPAPTSFPYDFNTIPVTLPVIKGLNIPAIPPPAPSAPSTASVPKPKSKEPNIFKLLPKLPYGAVLLAKTIYSGEHLSETVLNKVLMEMTKSIEQTTKEEQHKKGSSNIAKCMSELQKIIKEQNQEKLREVSGPQGQPVKQKSNRYEHLQRVYYQAIERLRTDKA